VSQAYESRLINSAQQRLSLDILQLPLKDATPRHGEAEEVS